MTVQRVPRLFRCLSLGGWLALLHVSLCILLLVVIRDMGLPGYDRPWQDLARLVVFAIGLALGLPYLIPVYVCLVLVGASDLSSVEKVVFVSLVVVANSWRAGYWFSDGLKTAWRNRYGGDASRPGRSELRAAVEIGTVNRVSRDE